MVLLFKVGLSAEDGSLDALSTALSSEVLIAEWFNFAKASSGMAASTHPTPPLWACCCSPQGKQKILQPAWIADVKDIPPRAQVRC